MGTAPPVRQAAHPITTARATRASTAAAPSLSPAEVRQAMRISIIEGAVANVHITITGVIGGSVFLTGFALLLGANSFQLGLIGALPFIGQLFLFVGAYLEERIGQRRPLVLYGALAGRLVWAVLLALPFLSFLGSAQLALFFAGLACTYALNGIAGNAWMSWMSDLVPPHQRGRYFGLRNTVAALTAMAATLLAGQALDALRVRGHEAPGYALVFGVAVLAAVGAAALIARQAEPPLARRERVSLIELFGALLRERPFRSFMLVSAGWAVVTGVAAPFFSAYGLATL